MSDVLDAVLSIFNCDRAWLVYPCDPEASSYAVQMQRTRPEFPGTFAPGVDVRMDQDDVGVLKTVRAASGPVRFGPGSEQPLPAGLAKHFNVQSRIAMAVYPKLDRPYMFGLSQCSDPRVWTPREERLFQEIGRRLEDALTSLLMFRHLRASERNLEEAQRLAHVGYWERDPETDRITWSDENYRIFGLPPQARILTLAQLPDLIHPDDQQSMVHAVAEALRGGRRYDVEYRVVRPNGEVRLVHSQGDVLRDESGRPRRMFGSVQDITERQRAEEALHQAQTALAHVTRVATLGELSASIAHEVNQPLAGVVTNGQACLRWLAREVPDLAEARAAVERIIRDGQRASEVIQRIRALATKTDPHKVPLDLNDVIHEVVLLVHREVLGHRVALRTDLAAALPPVLGDRVQLQQVLINLVINGIEAMAPVTDRPRQLLIRSHQPDADQVLVAVQDSGIGIDPADVDRLFNAFFTTKPSGMGMGLSISRSIIEAHGGRLWASRNVGPGATVQFTLPLPRAHQA
jgi:PAS domain S-box-containing protein